MDAQHHHDTIGAAEAIADNGIAAGEQDVLLGTAVQATEERQTPAAGRPAVAAGLSAVMEGFGQAYNRQPAKAIVFFTAGMGFSTASGLNTWIVRNVFGLKKTRIGPEQVNPFLLGLWAVTYALNVADAWRTAGRPDSGTTG